MKSVADRSNVPPVATTTEAKGETILKVPSKKISVSEETLPFPCAKVGMQPCMSYMSFTEDPVLRREEASALRQETCKGYVRSPIIDADSIQKIGGHRITYSEADRRFWATVAKNYRAQAVKILGELIRCDDKIDVEGAKILCDAVNVIDRAGVRS